MYQTDDIYNTRRANSEPQLSIHRECKSPLTVSVSAVTTCNDASESVLIENNEVACRGGSRI